MKKILFSTLCFLFCFISLGSQTFAEDDNITMGLISDTSFKTGDLTLSDVPVFISGVIQFVIGIAGTMSILALIYHAVQMQINSGISGDSSGVDKAKKGMYGALIGFVLTILSWFIITRVIQILYSAT